MLSVLKRFRSFLRPYRGIMAVAVFFMLLVDVVGYALPAGIGWLTDAVFPRIGEPGMLETLVMACGALALFQAVA